MVGTRNLLKKNNLAFKDNLLFPLFDGLAANLLRNPKGFMLGGV